MAEGIAVSFKEKYHGQAELEAQQKQGVGEVATIQRDGRWLFYLVTKPHFYDKSSYKALRMTLEALKEHWEAIQCSLISVGYSVVESGSSVCCSVIVVTAVFQLGEALLGFEPTTSGPSGLEVSRLNHSATAPVFLINKLRLEFTAKGSTLRAQP
ncbi:hypothetical protein ACOMHN_062345 [Nucella lapillus]